MMDLGLKGKMALVTGGSSGIGFAIAEALVEEGVNVVIASRDYSNVEAAVKKLKRKNPTVKIVGKELDLNDEKKIRKVVGEIQKLGVVDILVNNVGGPTAGATLEISLEGWDKGYQSLLRSVILLSQLLIPGMKKKKWGRMITITSTSAAEIIPKLPVSATFRAGLTAYAKGLAKEVGRVGVLVNNLLPGPTGTARLEDLKKKSPAFFESMAQETAVGRIAEPREIAKVAVFLVSNANTYVTGTDILADGGYTKAL
ncbi:MAG: SDR family oxidoreductase [Deltaproteobacteria bacterium]|nr:SDR family oxidoreductase [Deltaproteobacteria bacterium]